MSIRNEIESFIEGIYADCPGPVQKTSIVALAREAFIAPDIVDLLRHVGDGAYDKDGFIDAVNGIITERQLEDLTGGLVRSLAER